MSGHSKWHKIQHKKGKADKARSSSFTKLLRAVMVAAQSGGDPDMNFSLRLAIDKAKAGNVPKDNIARAIKRGTGEDKEGVVFEEALYEGFGHGGVALLIECLTDNKNRTVSDVKYILTKNGGSAAGPGSVQWQFERKGIIRIPHEQWLTITDQSAFELALMDAGMEDLVDRESFWEIQCPMDAFKHVLDCVSSFSIEPEDAALEWVAKETMDIDDATMEKVGNIVDLLEENDDVRAVYTNIA